MVKALIIYYFVPEKGKITNMEKSLLEIEKLFVQKKVILKKMLLKSKRDITLKEQIKKEKDIQLREKIPNLNQFDLVIIGTPIIGSLSSAPLVNAFIRGLPKQINPNKPKFFLFSVGVIHGFELKKMRGLLSMKGIKPIDSRAFTSIFDFDDKKLIEVRQFFEKIIEQT